jgi:hypothetical protein
MIEKVVRQSETEKSNRSSNFVPISEFRLIMENRKRQGKTKWIKSVLIILDQLINNTFPYNFSFKNDRTSIESTVHFYKKTSLWQEDLKNPNGVQNVYLRGTSFSGVRKGKMGYCIPKWGTFGSPGLGFVLSYFVWEKPGEMYMLHSRTYFDRNVKSCI